MADEVKKEIPEYTFSETVRALRIKEVLLNKPDNNASGGRLVFEEEGFEPLLVDAAFLNRQAPKPGGWLVYANDRTVFMKADAFDAACKRHDDAVYKAMVGDTSGSLPEPNRSPIAEGGERPSGLDVSDVQR